MHHCSGAINDATSPALGLLAPRCSQSLFQFVQVSDTFSTPFLAIVSHTNQLDSNLVNLQATVEVG